MSSLQCIPLLGYEAGGLTTNTKPYLLMDKAFPVLQNAYVWRNRVKKREGLKLIGRLERDLTSQSLGNTAGGPPNTITFSNIFTTIGGFTGENPEIKQGTLVITIGAPDSSSFTDNGNGTFTVTGIGIAAGSFVNYATGNVVLNTSGLTGGAAITANFSYYPSLPVMGIVQRELPGVDTEQTIWFDQKYAYDWSGTAFQEFIPGTTWAGSDADFFWSCNYRGTVDSTRLLFVTNFVNDTSDPIRYTDGSTWTNFSPLVTATTTIFQARLIIPYYGRLLLFNTWEGTTAGGPVGATQFFNRCRFSTIGDPTNVNAFRSDIFGQGGFIDASTNEEIVSAAFVKNTLIVWFSNSTWQLRYVGEYGLPFIWERISSDFGSESTFSSVLFDAGTLTVGDKAIISSNANGVERIDLAIPDTVFSFRNPQGGIKRVQGIRDFQRELVYWCYSDFQFQRKFPNTVLCFNYRNNTWAQFRENITAFGTFLLSGITVTLWDSLNVFWDDFTVLWDDVDTSENFPSIVSGNAEGFVHAYGYTSMDEASMSITGIDLTKSPIQVTIQNHNLETGDFVYINGLQFVNTSTSAMVSTNLNATVYKVQRLAPGDPNENNIIGLEKWDGQEFIYLNYTNFPGITPAIGAGTYVGGGTAALLPVLNVLTKDFNPYLDKGIQTKLSYVDFLMESTSSASMSVTIYTNTSPSSQGNLLIGNTNVETSLTSPYYVPDSDIAWHRFYATTIGQFFALQLTYSDALMNDITNAQQSWELNSINLWTRPGGKLIF